MSPILDAMAPVGYNVPANDDERAGGSNMISFLPVGQGAFIQNNLTVA